jgi:hypothetical protein
VYLLFEKEKKTFPSTYYTSVVVASFRIFGVCDCVIVAMLLAVFAVCAIRRYLIACRCLYTVCSSCLLIANDSFDFVKQRGKYLFNVLFLLLLLLGKANYRKKIKFLR